MKKSEEQRGPGRPRSSRTGEARRIRVCFMLTDSEFTKLETVAEDRRLSLSTMVHEIVTRYLARR